MTEKRHVRAGFTAWPGMIGSLTLQLINVAAGVLSGSLALVAFGARFAAEAIEANAASGAAKASGRAEPKAAIAICIISLLIGFALTERALYELFFAVDELRAPEWYALAVLLAALLAKESIAQRHSRSFRKNLWDRRIDAAASALAILGVGGAYIGGRVGAAWLLYADSFAALLISLLILYSSYRLIRDSIRNSKGRSLRVEETEELIQTAQSVHGVITVDELSAWEHGHYVVVDCRISVNPRITMTEGQDIAKAVKNELMKSYTHVSDVFIVVNPYDPGYPYKNVNDINPEDIPTLLH